MTDAGLAHLSKLTQLASLNLESCYEVTDAGHVQVQRAIPNCAISG